jgi:hypothetical protein
LMRIRYRDALIGLVALAAGCDSPGQPVAVNQVSAPHHGTMIRLAEDRGFVELVNEPEVSDRRKPEPTSIVAYFLQIDGKSPLEPVPVDVDFAIQPGAGKGGRTKPDTGGQISLTAQPNPDDPLSAARFASKPGPYALEGTRGILTARIGGQVVSTTFAGSR